MIGTPVDEHLNPDPQAVPLAIESLAPHLVDGQLIVLRSTVYPGVTRLVGKLIERLGKDIDVAFCPERIAEGKALTELFELPQIVAGLSRPAVQRARELFSELTTTSSLSSPKKPSWPNCSPTRGVTSGSPRPISST